ncbi:MULTISPECIES: metal ABC transporter ATP-binding protein [Staphylococcus]|uniref:Phosphonate ABC transporter ATP-binding protein n=1 Tax=Staphylococcus ureilyticus TaxID=94138 RepID=A0AB34AER1_STAUR|nr:MULTISPECIES: metal ABC transporter ATP-binding protein [Staphylococcus]AVL76651.1 metal ABC transporter ATP-binding protein [Staphylococcus cohnii]MBL0377443.1 metal ABC transporter ATP-binding protein [Staphylococcus sp. S75]MBL0382578.1 metal ABC transporter ATP-binding protein [Staphylococcus sp. S59]MBL0401340.1 metal ABC transporter ATP-binding protein [Staphylococcus sp. S36]MCT1915290.1 metal ABC transporter ATP-binding protein [Staphylococcus ureilyticus]
MLEINNLNLTLGNKHVLENINLEIPVKGEIIGIMGPNGAGKSSLLKSIIGEFKSTGIANLHNIPIQQTLKNVTYIPQKAHIDLDFPIKVEDVVLSGAYKDIGWFRFVTPKTRARLNQLLSTLELQDLRNRQISALSGGQLQRVLVARALMTESTLYLLDEPFVGIDFHSEQIIMTQLNELKEAGKLILIVHHDLSKAEKYFNRVILLNKTIRFFGESHVAMQPDHLNETFLNPTQEEQQKSESA